MSKLIVVITTLAFGVTFASCTHTPPSGGDPGRRDSIGEPLHPMDTTVDRRDPDTVSDTTNVTF